MDLSCVEGQHAIPGRLWLVENITGIPLLRWVPVGFSSFCCAIKQNSPGIARVISSSTASLLFTA